MIVARWSREKGKMTIIVEGHEGMPEGEAVICAYVSSIMQTAVCGLMAVAAEHPDKVRVDEIVPIVIDHPTIVGPAP